MIQLVRSFDAITLSALTYRNRMVRTICSDGIV